MVYLSSSDEEHENRVEVNHVDNSSSSGNDDESSIIQSSLSSTDQHHHIGGNYKKLYGKHN
jgi:hypothetical protein